MITGRIYKLISDETDDIYIGSTTQTLKERENDHKRDYKSYSEGKQHYIPSYRIVKYRDMKIELLFEGEFESIKDMHKLESEYIKNTANCINRYTIKRIDTEYNKEYYEKNKNKIREQKNIKIICNICGVEHMHNNRTRHYRSQKHQSAIRTPLP
jgi:hypothetical protein